MRRAEQLITLWILSKRTWGEPRTALQQSCLGRREETKTFGGFKRKILLYWTDLPDLQVCKLTEFVHLFLQCKLAVKNDSEHKLIYAHGSWEVQVHDIIMLDKLVWHSCFSSSVSMRHIITLIFNCNGWLCIKHQVTYLQITFTVIMLPHQTNQL